jgi:hypothetical protein
MATLMEDEDALASDVAPFARGQLRALQGELERGVGRTNNRATRLHYQDAMARIADILEGND